MNAKGIANSRLRFYGQRPIYEHLQVLSQADIALDAFPYNGTATTCESLLMGIPMVTQAGQFFVSRVGLALLNAVGLHDCVTTAAEAYVEAAVSLGLDRPRLAQLRSDLRYRFLNSAFGRAAEYTASLERAYLAILCQA